MDESFVLFQSHLVWLSNLQKPKGIQFNWEYYKPDKRFTLVEYLQPLNLKMKCSGFDLGGVFD